MSTDTFRGFPVDQLMALKHQGRALIDNDELYDAAQAYTDPAQGSGMFGRALLDVAPQTGITIRNTDDNRGLIVTAPDLPDDPPEEEDEGKPWEALSLLQLRDLLKVNNVEFPRTMTRWGAI